MAGNMVQHRPKGLPLLRNCPLAVLPLSVTIGDSAEWLPAAMGGTMASPGLPGLPGCGKMKKMGKTERKNRDKMG